MTKHTTEQMLEHEIKEMQDRLYQKDIELEKCRQYIDVLEHNFKQIKPYVNTMALHISAYHAIFKSKTK